MLRAAGWLAFVGAIGFMSGCGSSGSSAQLRLDLTRGAFGPRSYTLRCSPTGGTFPSAAAACHAVKSNGALLVSHPGRDHSCPAGPPLVHVSGTYGGRKIDAHFSVCTGGQEDSTGQWTELAHYGPVWVMQSSGQAGGARVSIQLRVALSVTRTYQSGVVTDVRLAAARGSSVFRARVYYGLPRTLIATRVKPGAYLASAAIRECLGNCDRLSQPRGQCAVPFTADIAEPARLDIRVKPTGTCLVQIEQHG